MKDDFLSSLYGLEGKVAVITGAIGQLGRAFCEAFLSGGCRVIGTDIRAGKSNLASIDYRTMDITSKESVSKTFEQVYERYGRIDILVNNAGVSTFEPFETREEKSFDWVMDVNLKGTFFCIQAYTNLFDKNHLQNGAIINIGSMYGMISPDFRIYEAGDRKNSEVYGATKAGIIQMTKYFATHLAKRNIRVNSVSPGGIFNPENPQADNFVKNYSFRCPMERMASANEMVGLVLYFASNAASYTTGQNVAIDGGMSCW